MHNNRFSRMINNALYRKGLSPFFMQNNGVLRTRYQYTSFVVGNNPLRVEGYSVGFSIRKNDDGKFSIVKSTTNYQGFQKSGGFSYSKSTSESNSEVIGTADNFKTAKKMCLEAFSAHNKSEKEDQRTRTDTHVSVIKGATVLPPNLVMA